MYNLAQLEKQQVGLRLPKYLVDDIEEFTKEFSLNRTDIIVEAIKSYIQNQKENLFYNQFDKSCKEAKEMIDGDLEETTLRELVDTSRLLEILKKNELI